VIRAGMRGSEMDLCLRLLDGGYVARMGGEGDMRNI
jgi:hypothetical protein